MRRHEQARQSDDSGARELAAAVRAVCERHAPEDRVRAIAADGGGFDAELWKILCEDIGIGAIAVPEQYGGAGYGLDTLRHVAHELGRVLAPVPLLNAVASTALVIGTGDQHLITTLLPQLMSGERVVATILSTTGRADGEQLKAVHGRDGWRVSGCASYVVGGAAADDLLLSAETDSGPALFHIVVRSEANPDEGLEVAPRNVLDKTRPIATVTFDDVLADPVAVEGELEALIADVVDRTIAIHSAEQVGACERVLEMACDYARTRTQFGRPIGSFQAVKHKCADMLVDLEWARSASEAAVRAVDTNSDERHLLSSIAHAVCSTSLVSTAQSNIQIHGGIGFTWEESAHLYFKRARTDEVFFGGVGAHWDAIAADRRVLP